MIEADSVLSTPPLNSSLNNVLHLPVSPARPAARAFEHRDHATSGHHLSNRAREALYDRCRGDAEFPTCNICSQLILVGDSWDESHDPEGPPRCFGGTETGVAHRTCNRTHGAQVVRPLDAKATRVRQKHIGAFQTRHKLPGGRTDSRKRKLDGEVVSRLA